MAGQRPDARATVTPAFAKQFANTPALNIAAQVPQGDIDGRDRMNDNAPPAVVTGEIVHSLPGPFDVRGIGANNNLI